MNESRWRLTCFAGTLLLMGLLEWLAPRKQRVAPRSARWLSHLGLVAINTLAAKLLIPLSAVGAASWAQTRGWGLLLHVQLPVWVEFALALVLLDLAIYGQHVLSHHVPLLWQLHKVHHADLDLDVTSGIRFHTLEILLSAAFKLGLVVVLGPSGLAVMVFEIILNAASLWSHSNVRLPLGIDRWLRLVLVTPDMHRVHHSVLVHETNSNYGFQLPCWDFLFRTYKAQPQAGHDEMLIGLASPREEKEVVRLTGLLAMPFRKDTPR
jgi:sterol desaturase/sphingolipid hydroxylase (fatty acid hydroxylase superfamily)